MDLTTEMNSSISNEEKSFFEGSYSTEEKSTYAYLAYPLGEHEFKTASSALRRVRSEQDIKGINKEIAEALILICDAGLESYYTNPSEIVNFNPMLRKAADAGMSTVMTGIRLVIKQTFKSMPIDQMQILADYMDSLLVADPQDTSKTYVAYVIPDDIYEETVRLMAVVKNDPNPESYLKDITDGLIRLADVGLEHYYSNPINLIKLKKLTRKAADLGINSVQKAVHSVIRKVFKGMPSAELVLLAEYMETLLLEVET